MCGLVHSNLAGVSKRQWRAPTPDMDIPALPMPRTNNDTPGNSLIVLTGTDTIMCMQWLIPAYQEPGEKLDFYKMFSARSETMLISPVFGRCLM